MESIQQVKNRIGSIAGTRQITQSMRLVSTAKLQRVRDRMTGNREFCAEAERIARAAAAEPDVRGHRFVRSREAARAAGLSCVLVVGGDRGLCGGYNTNVCRETQALIRELGAVRLVTVGQKAKEFFLRRRRQEGIARSFTGISETPFFEDAEEIAACVLDWFERGEIDAIYLVYTRFFNMLSLHPERKRLLPLGTAETETDAMKVAEKDVQKEAETATEAGGRAAGGGTGGRPAALTRFEPNSAALLEQAVPFYLASVLLGAMLESSVCEQSARLASMDTAVNNSGEMIEALTLKYNQARQGAITGDLIDIIGGASAVRRKRNL